MVTRSLLFIVRLLCSPETCTISINRSIRVQDNHASHSYTRAAVAPVIGTQAKPFFPRRFCLGSCTRWGRKSWHVRVRITIHITCRRTIQAVQVAGVSQHTLRAGAQLNGQPPSRERRVCHDARASPYTLRTDAQSSARRETRVQRRYTSQIVTDGVQTHTTTFVHASAWIVTLSVVCGVPAHTTTVVPAGA